MATNVIVWTFIVIFGISAIPDTVRHNRSHQDDKGKIFERTLHCTHS